MPRFGIEQLGLDPDSTAALAAFVRSWKDHPKPVLFAGAGLSLNASRKAKAPTTSRFATWTTLITAMRDELGKGNEEQKKALPQDPLRLAQIFESENGRGLLLDRIAQHVPFEDYLPGAIHRKLTRLPWEAIVTTNYDDLIERAFEGSRRVRRVLRDADLTQPRSADDLLIVKMHGDFSDRKSIVLTEEDYRLYEVSEDPRRAGMAVKIRQLLLEHPLMFVGFSLADPNFIKIDGWIRDTIETLRLPSIAVMHGPTVPSAEAHLWKTRGIHFVHLPNTQSEHLERLIDAIEAERDQRPAIGDEALDNQRVEPLRTKLRHILERRHEDGNWASAAAAILIEAIAGASTDIDRGAEARRLVAGFCNGYLGQAGPIDLMPVYEALLVSAGRSFLLFAHESGQIEFTPDRIRRIDLSAEALEKHALSPDERARILLARGRVHRDRGAFKKAKDDLSMARSATQSRDLRAQISEEVHDTLFLAGDPEELETELASSVDEEDAFALCRKGSQALLLRKPEIAEGWYDSAFKRATSGDERFVALWGLEVARARGTALDQIGDDSLRRARLEIPEAERPRAKEIFELHDDAGQALLDGKRAESVSKLREYLRESRRLGWPHSLAHSIYFPMELAAAQAASLLLSAEPGGTAAETSSIQEGLTIAVQFGLAGKVQDLFAMEQLSQVASDREASLWFRRVVGASGGIPRARDTRHVLGLAGIPLLEDASIAAETTRLANETIQFIADRETGAGILPETLRDRWESVATYIEHLPLGAVEQVIKVIEAAVLDSYVCTIVGVGRFSWDLWRDGGLISPRSPGITRVASKLAEEVQAAKRTPDPFWTREVVRLADSWERAHLLNDENRIRLASVASALLEHELALNDPRRAFVATADVLLSLDPTAKSLDALPERILVAYGEVENSSLRPEWNVLAARLIDRFAPPQLQRMETLSREYANQCLVADAGLQRRLTSPSSAAELLVAVAIRQSDSRASGDEPFKTILALGEKDGRALRTLLTPALRAPDEILQRAEEVLTARLERGIDVSGRLRDLGVAESWLLDCAVDRVRTGRIVESVIGRLTSESGKVRARAWLLLNRVFRAHPALYSDSKRRVCGVALSGGLTDPYWEARAVAALVLRAVAETPAVRREATTQLEVAARDPIALVRRTSTIAAASLLE